MKMDNGQLKIIGYVVHALAWGSRKLELAQQGLRGPRYVVHALASGCRYFLPSWGAAFQSGLRYVVHALACGISRLMQLTTPSDYVCHPSRGGEFIGVRNYLCHRAGGGLRYVVHALASGGRYFLPSWGAEWLREGCCPLVLPCKDLPVLDQAIKGRTL